jgi:hypothetical protein
MKSLVKNDTKENEKIKESNHLLVVSYITEENIERCWLYFSNVLKCEGKNSNIVQDYSLVKGKNTFMIGNEFSCYWVGVSNIHYKCIESKNNDGIRRIGWIIDLDIGFSIRKKYFIYPISNDSKTLIKLNLELIGSENHEPMDFEETREYYYKLQYTIINRIINVMNNSDEFHFIHESFIVNKNKLICWNNMIDLQKLSIVTSGEIGENFECNGDKEKVGTFWKCGLKNNKIIFLIVKNISRLKKRKSWKYCLETFGTQVNTLRQEVNIDITEINKDTTQISILIVYKEKIKKNIFDSKKKSIRQVVEKIKNFINNINN